MWIRSQDKHRLIKCNNIRIYVDFLDCQTKKFLIKNKDDTLGTYSTKEKALEVLDLIGQYQKYQYLKTSNYTGEPFQMPEDRGGRK